MLYPGDISQASPDGVQSAAPSLDVLTSVRRSWAFPIVGCLLGLAATSAYVALFPEPYKSSARLLIDRSLNKYLQANKIVDEPVVEETENSSQIYVLSSESILIPVVRSLALTSDPEFVGTSTVGEPPSVWSLGRIIRSARRTMGWTENATAPEIARERLAVESLLRRLTVQREDVASVITVTFASADPQKAAAVANAIAETYITTSISAKLDSTKLASQMIHDRIVDLQKQSSEADRALQDYKVTHNIAGTGRGFLTSEKMFGLNAELTNARIALAQAKSSLERVQQKSADGKQNRTRVMENDATARYRTQLLELEAKAAEIEGRVGRNHEAVVKLRRRIGDLRSAIANEDQRVVSAYVTEYTLAKARVDELSTAIAQVATEADLGNQAQAKMRDLESKAESLRSIYNMFLLKFNETNKLQPQSILTQDARIITRAAPQLTKSLRKPLALIGGGTILGLLMGIGAAVAKDLAAGVFRSVSQVRAITDGYCAALPLVRGRRERRFWQPRGARAGVEEYVLDAPYSPFAETMRAIRASIMAEQRSDRGTVVAIISAMTGEGKTTVAANLASLAAASKSSRVLLIDCDFREPCLTAELAPHAQSGLMEAIADPTRLPSLIVTRERSGLDVLPCRIEASSPHAAEVLGSPEMSRLLESASETYDLVVVEVPAIHSFADVRMIARFIDLFVFVVESGRTTQQLVREALAESHGIRDRIVCTVLNKADKATLRRGDSERRSLPST